MKTVNIRETLLSSLFLNPNPINKTEYQKSINHIFPDRELFVLFLRAENEQHIKEYAKDIIMRFVYTQHFPPASRLLFNLAQFEEKQKSFQQKGKFIPQDHFVHIVNLYLIGVYFFAYHHSLHLNIVSFLNHSKRRYFKKYSDGTELFSDQRKYNLNSYELFSTIWASFTLHHDLGYPLELLNAEQRQESENDIYLKPFAKILKSILKDISLKSLSKIIVLQFLLQEDLGTTFNKMFLENINKFELEELDKPNKLVVLALSEDKHRDELDEVLQYRDSIHIPKIEGINNLNTLLSFISDSKICAVLEDIETGQPILLIKCKDRNSKLYWFEKREYVPTKIINNKNNMFDYAFKYAKYPDEKCMSSNQSAPFLGMI